MKYLYLFFIISLLSSSCVYNVTVFRNGTAHVKISSMNHLSDEDIGEDIDQEELEATKEEIFSSFDNFTKSPLISNYKRSNKNGEYIIEFDLENIDSLNYFLTPSDSTDNDPLKTTFQYTKKCFIIDNTLEEDGPNEVTMYGELFPLQLHFEFEQNIKELKSELDFVKKVDNKTIEINSSLNDISYGKGNQRIEVLLK